MVLTTQASGVAVATARSITMHGNTHEKHLLIAVRQCDIELVLNANRALIEYQNARSQEFAGHALQSHRYAALDPSSFPGVAKYLATQPS